MENNSSNIAYGLYRDELFEGTFESIAEADDFMQDEEIAGAQYELFSCDEEGNETFIKRY